MHCFKMDYVQYTNNSNLNCHNNCNTSNMKCNFNNRYTTKFIEQISIKFQSKIEKYLVNLIVKTNDLRVKNLKLYHM